MPRDGGLARMYSGSAWKVVRRRILERDGWTCRLRLPGCEIVATTVDHIVSPRIAPGLFYEATNLRSACGHCNFRRGAIDGNRARAAFAARRPSREW